MLFNSRRYQTTSLLLASPDLNIYIYLQYKGFQEFEWAYSGSLSLLHCWVSFSLPPFPKTLIQISKKEYINRQLTEFPAKILNITYLTSLSLQGINLDRYTRYSLIISFLCFRDSLLIYLFIYLFPIENG